MDKLQLRYTPDEAEQVAAAIERALEAGYETDQRGGLAAQAARLRHLAARARQRAGHDQAADDQAEQDSVAAEPDWRGGPAGA